MKRKTTAAIAMSMAVFSLALWKLPSRAQQTYAPWPPANGGYAPPVNGGYAPAVNGGYAPAVNGGYAQGGAAAPFAGSAAAPYPPGVTPPPSGSYQPTWQPIPGTTAPPPYNAPAARPAMPPQSVNPALEQLIPNFRGPLPQVPPSMQGPAPPGPGFASGWTPGSQPQGSAQEQRVARLEQTAFGATYPEHEVDDRVEHLEREVFGRSEDGGDLDLRLGKLEAKLGGGAAFGRTAAPMPPNMPPRVQTMAPPVAPNIAQMPGPGMQPPVMQPPNIMQPPPPMVPESVLPQTAVQQRYQPPGTQPAGEKAAKHSTKEKPKEKPKPAAEAKETTAKEAAKMPAPSAAPPADSDQKAGDYFTAMQVFEGGSYAHWTQFPVRVHVPMNSPPNWQAAVDSAIAQWSKAVPIMVVSPDQPADIELAWINHLQPKQFGITNLEVFNGRMRVTVYLLRPSDYPASISGEKKLPIVAAHEIGHALGLWGHSQTAGDIMHPLDTEKNKATIVTARDINTLKRVYQAPGLAPGYQSPQPVGWP